MKFTITRIESGKVYAREKNPLGERPEKEWFGSPHDPVFESYHKVIMGQKKKWQEAEKSLKEYPLSEESVKINIGDSAIVNYQYVNESKVVVRNLSMRKMFALVREENNEEYEVMTSRLSKFITGQEISGTVVNGEIVIR